MRRFLDRRDAGRWLAEEVGRRFPAGVRPEVVLGIPRGGLIVAAASAAALDLPLDVVVARKLGAPGRPELGVGAVGEDGVEVLHTALLHRLGIDPDLVRDIVIAEQEETARRVAVYVGDRPRVPLAGRRVLLVDDGLATGYTALAAIEVARRRGAAAVVVAVPVAGQDAVAAVTPAADAVVALRVPRSFVAVGAAYRDFAQTTDDEVVAALCARPS